eukprot:SAG31_NODE_1561_length_7872_cov_2.787469_3_plen_156_part_00
MHGLRMRLEEKLLLCFGPCTLVNVRAEMILPPAFRKPIQTQSSRIQATPTIRVLTHRSLHCLPTRPGKCDAMADHFRGPYWLTSPRIFLSSCATIEEGSTCIDVCDAQAICEHHSLAPRQGQSKGCICLPIILAPASPLGSKDASLQTAILTRHP